MHRGEGWYGEGPFASKGVGSGGFDFVVDGGSISSGLSYCGWIELKLDESSLTVENHAMHKISSAMNILTGTGSNSIPVMEQRNLVFMGSLMTSGRGRALVLAMGECTEFGKVDKELSKVEERNSPLHIKIEELGKIMALLSTIAIIAIAVLGWLIGRQFLVETVTVAVILAVAAIPEALPICVTVTLALGVLRMARTNAIVKKLLAVEALGCATVVASDKTVSFSSFTLCFIIYFLL